MAGVFPGFTAATLPLTGSELIPADTQIANGVNPQTETITAAQLKGYVLGNVGSAIVTATATAGAATANGGWGVITSESITTAAGADYVLTLTNSAVTANSVVLATAANGTNTTEGLAINRVQPSAGSVIIRVRNTHASSALNGTIKVAFAVLN